MQPPVLGTLGKYQLVRKLAVGGMAEVFLAKTIGPGGFEKTLVLKRVLSHLADDETFIAMFQSEAKLAAQLNHPNVVSIFDFGQEGDTHFLVMEYIDGPNLRALFRRAFELGQPLPFHLAAKIISSACEGLAYAHDFVDPETGQPMELVHRDISPDNILLGRNGGVKVVDFGIAKAANQSHHTKTGTIKGKFAYMAPEQLRGQPLDRRADIFALGIVLYELIAGSKPFDTTTDASIMQAILFEKFKPTTDRRPETPPELQRILDRALEKDRDDRYPDCTEFAADLDQFIVNQGAPAGQHQLAQLVVRLASSGGPAMATPSPKPSQPNLPRAPTGAGLAAGNQADYAERKTISSLRSAVATQPLVRTPAPVAVPVSLGAPKLGEPARIDALADVELSAMGHVPLPAPRNLVPIFVGVGVLAAVLIAAALWFRSAPEPYRGPQVVEIPSVVAVNPSPAPPTADPVKAVDPVAIHAADPSPTPVAAAPSPVKTPAGRPPKGKKLAVAEPKLQPAARTPDPQTYRVTEQHKAPEPAKTEMGLVDFRVRPYASVFVNGTFYGVTPFAKVKLNVGTHSVKLVNKDIGKEVTLSYEVKAGENTLKYNLETAE